MGHDCRPGSGAWVYLADVGAIVCSEFCLLQGRHVSLGFQVPSGKGVGRGHLTSPFAHVKCTGSPLSPSFDCSLLTFVLFTGSHFCFQPPQGFNLGLAASHAWWLVSPPALLWSCLADPYYLPASGQGKPRPLHLLDFTI